MLDLRVLSCMHGLTQCSVFTPCVQSGQHIVMSLPEGPSIITGSARALPLRPLSAHGGPLSVP
eukprot:1144566-Pelagomonas_calceolata.AAC.4